MWSNYIYICFSMHCTCTKTDKKRQMLQHGMSLKKCWRKQVMKEVRKHCISLLNDFIHYDMVIMVHYLKVFVLRSLFNVTNIFLFHYLHYSVMQQCINHSSVQHIAPFLSRHAYLVGGCHDDIISR